MAVTLRANKGLALTHAELDANFTDFMTLTGTGASRTLSAIFATTFNSTSDLRLKENIEPIINAEALYEVNGYTFNFKNDEDKKKNYGLIAQELLPHFPALVSIGKDGYFKVNYDAAVPILVELLKKQRAEIEDIKREIADLKTDLAK